jgi:hypothetical protein
MGSPQIEIELWPYHFRIKCSKPGYPNLALVIVRRVADGGAPEGQIEMSNRTPA